MENSLAELMSSENKTGTVTFKIIQRTSLDNLLIVADSSKFALLNIEAYPQYSKLLKIDQTYKLIKCKIEKESIIPSDFKPVVSKKKIEVPKNKVDLDKIKSTVDKPHAQTSMSLIDLEQIEEKT